jgi:hypothetical protein
VSIYFDADPRIAVNSGDQQVTWTRSHLHGLTVLNVGSRDQQPLNRTGDNLRIDWGYFHIAVPESEHAETAESSNSIDDFVKNGSLTVADDMEMPLSPDNGAPHLAIAFPLGKVGSRLVHTGSGD